MLDTMPPFVDVLLSNSESWLTKTIVDAPLRAANSITPNEPSTLALAIVGIASLAVYAGVKGWRASRRRAAAGSPAAFQATVRRRPVAPSKSTDSTRKRGAA
jgi:hypothetical protein